MSATIPVENLQFSRGVAQFSLKSGTLSFVAPTLGRSTLGVFVGQGEFRFTPPEGSEARQVKSLTGQSSIAEPFDQAVFLFTDNLYAELHGSAKPQPFSAPAAADALRGLRARLRRTQETPRSRLEAMLLGDPVDNQDAQLLADLLNPRQEGFFTAYIHGRKYGDLRYLLKPRGAMPDLPSPEECALLHLDPGGESEGIWYMGRAAGKKDRDKRVVESVAYELDTTIQKNRHLQARAVLRFRALKSGDRVLPLGLLSRLRVSAVTSGGSPVPFIQEDAKADGALYLIWPEPLVKGKEYEVTLAYAGDRVIIDAGGGNLYVLARTSWYPNFNAFQDRARYDLVFRYPKSMKLASVGKLVEEKTGKDVQVSRWSSDIPLAVAGFNCGSFKRKDMTAAKTGVRLEGYATSEVPGYLRDPTANLPVQAGRVSGGEMSITPSSLLDAALSQSQAALAVYSSYFGAMPYPRLAVTQQPDFNWGQSWPGLVYIPLSAFLDSTTRWRLLGGISNSLTAFVDEVTAHEVSHQWWGHLVGWETYRDQWLSEGFAEFSTGLFLQATEPKPDKYLRMLERSRERLFEKNQYGRSPSEAGPIDLGLRLSNFRCPRAYGEVVYSKGGFVLHMLRMMMWDDAKRDEAFIRMMREFVTTHTHKTASTASFQAIAEKHMLPAMDLTNNGKLDWFFDEWVRGIEIPKYDFDYQVTPQDGKFALKARLQQSGVSDGFRMSVPMYIEWEGGRVQRLGKVKMYGNTSIDNIQVLLPAKPKRVLANAYLDVLARK